MKWSVAAKASFSASWQVDRIVYSLMACVAPMDYKNVVDGCMKRVPKVSRLACTRGDE